MEQSIFLTNKALTHSEVEKLKPIFDLAARTLLEAPIGSIIDPIPALKFVGNLICLTKGIRNKKSVSSIKQFFLENSRRLEKGMGVMCIAHFVFRGCGSSLN